MRKKGKITHWNAERGFGFVAPAAGGKSVFLHITAISDRRHAPVEGDIVSYDLAVDGNKGPRAVNVKWSVSVSTRPKPQAMGASGSSIVSLVVASLFSFFVVVATLAGRLPLTVIATYGVISIVTLLVYWFDKAAAKHGRWRTKESSLLFLGLAGGWPGAVVAQRVLRHKTRKSSFQVAFWGTVVMNSVALGWLLTDTGSKFLDRLLK